MYLLWQDTHTERHGKSAGKKDGKSDPCQHRVDLGPSRTWAVSPLSKPHGKAVAQVIFLW